jgi:hypothetical protein
MKFSATHPVFGEISFDGKKVSVENDSLSKALNRLMDPDEYEKLRLPDYTPGLQGRFMVLLAYLGIASKLSDIHFEPDPQRPRDPNEPPAVY